MYNLAWIGTGQCDPNKDLIWGAVIVGLIALWAVIITFVIKSIRSKNSTAAKIGYSLAAVLIGLLLSLPILGITAISQACSG